jgi:protein TonB
MRPDLFGNVVRPSFTIGSRKWYTLPCSILIHALVVAAVIIAPLAVADVLPVPPSMIAYIWASPAPPPPPPPPPPAQAAAPKAAPNLRPAVPFEAPTGVRPDSGLVTSPIEGPPGGVEGGLPDALVGSGINVLPEAPPPPPPATAAPVRPGGDLRPPTRTKYVLPTYPVLAQSARVQGVVIIEAVIGTDGKVRDTNVLRSIPLLDQAAMEAVRQWEYTPSRLNGVPVPVLMTVTVTFTLHQ